MGETLAEEMVLITKGYSAHKAFSTIDSKLSFEKVVRGECDVISENLQMLSKFNDNFLTTNRKNFVVTLMLMHPITSNGTVILQNFPPTTRELADLEGCLLLGKNPNSYCLKKGKRDFAARCREQFFFMQNCICGRKRKIFMLASQITEQFLADKAVIPSSSESEDEGPEIQGLNYREEKIIHKAAKKMLEKGDWIFKNEATRKVNVNFRNCHKPSNHQHLLNFRRFQLFKNAFTAMKQEAEEPWEPREKLPTDEDGWSDDFEDEEEEDTRKVIGTISPLPTPEKEPAPAATSTAGTRPSGQKQSTSKSGRKRKLEPERPRHKGKSTAERPKPVTVTLTPAPSKPRKRKVADLL